MATNDKVTPSCQKYDEKKWTYTVPLVSVTFTHNGKPVTIADTFDAATGSVSMAGTSFWMQWNQSYGGHNKIEVSTTTADVTTTTSYDTNCICEVAKTTSGTRTVEYTEFLNCMNCDW